MIRGIIFDLDGTLLDTYVGLFDALNRTLAEFGKDAVNLSQVKRMVGRGVENLMQQAMGMNYPAQALASFKVHYEKTSISGTRILPQVVDTLTELHKRRITMAVASNKPASFTEQLLRHFGLQTFFAISIGPDLGVAPKPDPHMFNVVLQKIAIRPEEALYVGDMPLDVESARAAGIRVALVPTGGGELYELQAAGPEFLLKEFSDLITLLKED